MQEGNPPDFSAGLNLDKTREDYSFRMWILKEALILTDQSSTTSAVLNFTERTWKRDSLTNTHLALHCKEKVLPGYVPTFPNADTRKKVGTNSYSFAKSLPDLLSEFSFRQQITSHASGLPLGVCEWAWHLAAHAKFCFLLLNHMLYFQLFPTGQSWIVLKDGTVALLVVLMYQL